MKPIYIENYCDDIYEHLLKLDWVSYRDTRKEYFMASKEVTYTYGNKDFAKSYTSKPYTLEVLALQEKLNTEFKTNYNVMFANLYNGQHDHLGWHSDDSPEMNQDHPICSVSFGSEREIYWKEKTYSGVIPDSNKQLLKHCSLFIMPGNFQKDHLHKIPKNNKIQTKPRISLTFRNYNGL